MRSLLRLLSAHRIAPKATPLQRTLRTLDLGEGVQVTLLQVHDSRARRIRLSVDERGARLTLPTFTSPAATDAFLQEHQTWLQDQLAKQSAHGQPLQRGITASLPLRGEEQRLSWAVARASRIAALQAGQLQFAAPEHAGAAALQRALRDFYEAEARSDLGRWLPRLLPTLPRPPRRFVFKRTVSQWGSLAPDGSVSLDLALVLARPAAFEYVLVHELCHLLQANHSTRFWREVEARFPSWEDERDYLRREGRALKGRLRRLLAG